MSKNPSTSHSHSTEFSLSVIVAREEVKTSRWISDRWEVRGTVAGETLTQSHPERTMIRADENGEQYLWTGLRLELFKDDAESYYFNLMGEKPSVFVICRMDEDEEVEEPMPFLTTLSYTEATSYMEVDDSVYSVPIPPEIYVWVERYVVENYVPEKKKKRKREDWSKVKNHGRA